MGAAQSQAARLRVGSIAHPAVKTALKISAIGVLHFIGHLLCRLQGTDPGIGPPVEEFSFGLQTTPPNCDPEGRANRTGDRNPQSDPAADPGKDGGQD